MRYSKTWLILLMVALMALWGCSDDDDDDDNPVDPGMTAFEVIAEAGKAYINDSGDCPGVIDADLLNDNLDDYTVIDIRSEADYLAGHIPGAYNSSFGTILDDLANVIPSDKPYVVACYSGQSAGHVKVAMEMMGYEDTKSLLFGMSSWNSTLSGSWDNNVNNLLANAETDNNNGDLTVHALPELTEDASTVVADRVATMLTDGFQAIRYGDIQDNLDDYFIVNYFGEADYLGQGTSGVPGHIPGAFQFTPYSSLGWDEMLENLPTDMPVVVYCWTGQHSSQVTAYLNMLGYEALSLSFGSNSLFHDQLTAHKWTDAAKNDYALEAGPMMSAEFAALVDEMDDYLNDSGDCPGTINADDLHDNLDDYEVVDVRSADDYNAGHIPGAVHGSVGTILTDVADAGFTTDTPIVVACYSGQSAGHAKIALELAGYENVKSLLFGMSSWSSTLSGSWDNNVANNLAVAETDNNNDELTWHSYPTLDSYDVADRIDAMLAGGFQSIRYTDIQDNLDEYFILNYFGEADYLGEGTSGVPGHIPGAYQFTPYQTLGAGQWLAYLPTDVTIVVYCWTGQHSSQVTAYLNMLGYDAKSLSFGSNGLFHDQLTAHKWTDDQKNDYELEVTPTL